MRQRNVRVSDAVWEAAQAKADERRENLSEFVRQALVKYARQK